MSELTPKDLSNREVVHHEANKKPDAVLNQFLADHFFPRFRRYYAMMYSFAATHGKESFVKKADEAKQKREIFYRTGVRFIFRFCFVCFC